MSYEGDKARLVRELADAQAQIRAQYGMTVKTDPLTAETETQNETENGTKPSD